ncbi:hypothetical protein DH2020_013582 [Rehmannia glutinosa]|uniref:NB-ARC domain-containing protein n=1 Tax=Rehmannia glutinosa TaxID=99300 RepID=A0ABR0X2P3_REHGL
MAYAALVSLTQLLDQIMHYNNIPLSEEQELQSLQEKLTFLQAFLENYSHNNGKPVEFLEAQIRDTAYQAQDIVESHISDQVCGDDNCCGFERCFRYLGLRRSNIEKKYEKDLLTVMEQFDSIIEEVINIQRNSRVENLQHSYTSASASSTASASSRNAPSGRDKMVGFDEDLLRIKDRLCGESPKLGIISIVGMGGIGKTTLSRNIFDDSLIAYYFHIRAWITISQDYLFREVLLSLLNSLTVITKDLSLETDYQLAENVYKSLKGRTYLIILDDMWSTKAWDDLKRFFPDDYNGSRIVITTRLLDVASYASSSPVHQLRFLNEDQSWNLLREKVFGQQSCQPKLEKIGRIIAKNCGGLPLAISVVAGVLVKGNRTEYHWRNIARNISGVVTKNDEHFSMILTLSYDHLPYHLKKCFLYMGGFPEDYGIPVSKLIKLWVAEGFLKPVRSKSLEEIAEEYLEDLVKRNLVLISKKRSNGKYRFCGIHDLMRDLCIRKAEEENFLHVLSSNAYTSQRGIKHHRRLIIFSDFTASFFITTSPLPIRSVLNFSRCFLESFVLGFRLLRVLDALKTSLEYFPVEITELFHLRYLAFSYYAVKSELKIIPPSISKLRNLQTLIIHPYPLELYLPFQIWKMPQLMHLMFKTCVLLVPLAARIGWKVPVLENLQTLSTVKKFRFTSKALEMIPNLKKLKVHYTGVSQAKWSKYCLNNLVRLRQLETLSFSFRPTSSWRRDPFSTSFALPPNLKKLTLTGCRFLWEDMAIVGSLPNLEVLKLRDYAFLGREWESNEGEFGRLKFLLMEWLNLKCWRAESSHFPCLEHLVVRSCWQLEEIPCEIGEIPTLRLIEVGPRSKLAADSALLIQEEQRNLGNDILQVRLYS